MDEDHAAEKLAHLARRTAQQRKWHYARQPKSVKDIVAQLMVRKGYGATKSDERLQNAWSEAVGAAMAKLTSAARISRGRLEVIVSNNLVMQELGFDRQRLMQELNQALPEAHLTDIRFRIGKVSP